jgi:hypothetical protein
MVGFYDKKKNVKIFWDKNAVNYGTDEEEVRLLNNFLKVDILCSEKRCSEIWIALRISS